MMTRLRFAFTRARALVVAAALVAHACSIDDPVFTPLDAGDPIDATDGPPAEVALMVSSTEVTVEEQATQTFTAVLTAAPAGNVLVNTMTSDVDIVTVTPGALLFTPDNWSTPQTVTLSGRDDADTLDDAAVVTLTPDTPAIDPVPVDVTVSDNDGLAIVAAPAALDVTEGASAPITVHLSAQPPADVVVTVASSDTGHVTVAPISLTFTPANWDLDQTVIVNGVEDANTVSETAMVTFTSATLVDVAVSVTAIDDDILGITPSTANLGALPEGGAGSFTVRLSQQPPGNLVVMVASSDGALAVPAPAMLTFTTANWNTPQAVSVALPDDADTANEAATITLSAPAAPGVMARTVALAILDDDSQTILVSTSTVAVDEGMTRTFGVHLAFQPAADVTVAVTSMNPTVATALPAVLTFTAANYAVDQTVTVAAPQDMDAASGMTALRLEAAAESISTTVTVAVTDDDQLLIETSTTSITLGEGGTATFGVRLSAMPVAGLAVAIGSADTTAATIAPATLSFSTANWNVFQNVTVSGVADGDLASEAVAITLSSSGLPGRTVDATVTDDDTQVIVATATSVSVNDDGTATVGFSLGFQPTASTTVMVASADTSAATVAPASLTFTPANFATPQQVTITGVEDPDLADDTTTITASSTGATPATVTVTVNDTGALGIETNPTTLTVAEGGTGTIGVRLTAQPLASTTVAVASSDATGATVTPAMLTFTTASWNVFQNVTVTGAADADAANDSVTVTASSTGLPSRTVTVTVTDDEVQGILVAPPAITVAEGGTGTFTVRLAAEPTGNVVVTVGSSDTGAATVAPATLTFTVASYATPQTVTVTGVADADLANESVTITASSTGLPSRTVAATITDDDMQTILVSPAALTIDEGSSRTFAVTLGFAPAANVTVTLSTTNMLEAVPTPGTLTFTPANFATPQTVTVNAPHDADAGDNGTVITASATGATAGTVNVSIVDDDELLIETSVAAVSIAETGTTTFGVRLTAQPSASTTIAIASADTGAATAAPATLTFTTGNWNTFQNVTVTGVPDADPNNESVSVTASSTGLVPRTVIVTVSDDDPQAVVLSTTAVTVAEGGTATFGVSLAAMPSANVTVTITSPDPGAATVAPNPLTFTPANYATPQLVTVTGVADADLANESVALAIASTGLPGRTVNVSVTDDDMQTVVVSPPTLALTEGGSGTFGVTLGFAPAGNVVVTVTTGNAFEAAPSPTSLTFTPGNYATAQTVTVNAPHDADAGDNGTTITASASGATSGVVTVNVDDDDVLALETSVSALTITEPGTGTFGVRLTAQPSTSVTVAVSSSDTGAAAVAPTSLTFTTANWSTYQTVTATGVADADTAAESVTITATSAITGTRTVALTVTDDDVQDIIASTAAVTLGEAGTATFTLALAAQPAANLVVSVASGDTGAATVSPTSLTFTPANYATPQTVTVTGVADLDLADETVTISAVAAPLTRTITATVTDDDMQIVLASPTSLGVTEGGNGTVGVTLGFQPAANVTVTVSSANTAVATAGPATLTFTPANYATAQTVTISGTNDADTAAGSTTIGLTAPGATAASVAVAVTDDDILGLDTSVSTLTIGEAGSGTFGVRLTALPAGNVTVTVASGDAGAATVAPTTLTFTTANWSTYQTVTATGVNDADGTNESVSVTVSSTCCAARTVTVSVTDNDPQGIVTSVASLTIGEAGSGTFGVTLAAQPPANVTVTIASPDPGAATVSPATLTFTPSNYATAQTVTVTGVADLDLANESVAVTASSTGLTTRTVTVAVTDDDMQVVQVSTANLTLSEGATGSFGVTLAFIPTGTVTVAVASNNTLCATVSPSSLTFNSANYNAAQTVTVTTQQDADAATTTCLATASATGATSGNVSVNVLDDETLGFDLSVTTLAIGEAGSGTFGVRLTAQPLATTAVAVGSSDTGAATITPAMLSFTTSNWNVYQTVTVTGVADADAANESVTITASATGLSSRTVTTTVTDDETQDIVLSASSLTITEGGSGTYTVRLAAQPLATTTVTLASSNTAAATVSPASLSFTSANYATAQTVTVTGTQDGDLVASGATISASSAGLTTRNLTVTVNDNDTQSIVATRTSVQLNEGASTTVGVSLAFQPAGNVTVNVTSSNTGVVTVTPTPLTFTPSNYNVVQNVTLNTPADTGTVHNTASITLSATGLPSVTIAFQQEDDDLLSVTAPGGTGGCPGDEVYWEVELLNAPLGGSLTVDISSSNSLRVSPTPTSLSFTSANWSTARTVFGTLGSSGSATVTFSANGQTSRTSTVSVLLASSPVCSGVEP